MDRRGDDGLSVNARAAVVLAFLAVAVAVSMVANSVAPGLALVGFAGLVATGALVAKGAAQLQRERRCVLSGEVNGERELLRAIRDNGGSITPAEAAMEAPLSVKEADLRLSELASGGYLLVEYRSGALCYMLPGGAHGPTSVTQIDDGSR